ncbi:lipase, partial [Pseudomonas aeruginosa]
MKKKSLLPLGLAIGLASLAASPLIQASTSTQTKYPIVLAHGMLG